MTREELRDQFRVENPAITVRVIKDPALNTYMKSGNVQVCCDTRCIMSNESEIIESVADTQFYDLESNISNFYDIDDLPGGGVYYDDLPLVKSSAGEMNYKKKNWKESSSGTPKKYWRRGKWLWFDVPCEDADLEIAVDCILKPDDFDDDAQEPFNGLGTLQPYTDAIVKYMQWRCKQKKGKENEAARAKKEYDEYVAWMRKRVKSAKFGPIYFKPSDRG